jgi:hypothetical protein
VFVLAFTQLFLFVDHYDSHQSNELLQLLHHD